MAAELFSEIPTAMLALVAVFGITVGWLLDDVAGDVGAGMIGNTAFLEMGALAGLLGAVWFGIDLRDELVFGFFIALISGAIVLLMALFVRARIVI